MKWPNTLRSQRSIQGFEPPTGYHLNYKSSLVRNFFIYIKLTFLLLYAIIKAYSGGICVNRINRLKISIYKDILITLFLVLVSIPIWLSFDLTELEEAKKYDNYNYINYEYLNNPHYTLMSVSDDYGLKNIETQDIVVYNYTKADATYTLVLRIDKNSTINIEDIRLNVNFEVQALTNYRFYEDSKYYYYIIDSDSIQGSSQKYVLSMWNAENIEQDINKTFDYDFVIM